MAGTTISKKERGLLSVKPPERKRFAEAFGISLEAFDERWRASKIDQVRPLGGAIPVINSAPAGLAEDYEEWGTDSGQGYTTIDRGRVEEELAFAVIVKGESMEPVLREGDVVVFSPLVHARDRAKLKDGKVVFVRFSEEPTAPRRGCTIGRFYWTDTTRGAFRLAKDNPKFPETKAELRPEHVARIGIGVELRRGM